MHRRIALISVLLSAAFVAVVVASAASARDQVSAPMKVTVTMSDFKFKLSKTSVPVGKQVVFTVVNKGPSPHDFDVATTKGTPVIAVGKQTTQKVTFKKKGSLRFLCTVPRHAQFGMVGTLKVS